MYDRLLPLDIKELKLYYTKYFLLGIKTQPAITCSMLTIETLEHGVKYEVI